MGLMPEEEDYTAPFQIEIFDLNTESTKSTYTVSHRYHMRVSCHTIGKKGWIHWSTCIGQKAYFCMKRTECLLQMRKSFTAEKTSEISLH